ncbi:MAG: hypothetical protein AB7I27_01810 [Bacteriovoracaceae bacterium]
MFKVLIIFFSFILLSLSVLAEDMKSCRFTETYKADGWVIHDPANFKKVEQEISGKLKKGLMNGSIVIDISGPLTTQDTVDKQEVLLAGYLFDDLRTDRDTMYGDIALVEHPEKNNQRVEIRWFDGKKRNIIINPNILTCFSEIAPVALNSVL